MTVWIRVGEPCVRSPASDPSGNDLNVSRAVTRSIDPVKHQVVVVEILSRDANLSQHRHDLRPVVYLVEEELGGEPTRCPPKAFPWREDPASVLDHAGPVAEIG